MTDSHRAEPGARMPLPDLTPDEVLLTIRAVRRRLDDSRPVADETIRECVSAAMQAPSGSNRMTMQFVVVRDAEAKRAIGEIYRQCYDICRNLDVIYIGSTDKGDPDLNAQQARSAAWADLLADRMRDAPAIVIPCSVGGRLTSSRPSSPRRGTRTSCLRRGASCSRPTIRRRSRRARAS